MLSSFIQNPGGGGGGLPLSGGTLTGALGITFGIAAATQGDGLTLTNSTAATSGNQTWSPSLRLTGNQWASGASRTCEFLLTCVPVQQDYDHAILRINTKHGANALVDLLDIRSFNGAPFIEPRSGSALTIGGKAGNSPLNLQYNSTVCFQFINGASAIAKDVTLNWTDATDIYGTKNVGIARSAAGVLKITDGTTGYGTLDAAAFRVGGTAGVDFSGAVTNITVDKGIVTAAS